MGAKRPKSLYIYLLLFPLISSVSPLTTLFLFACFFLFFLLCLSNFLKFSKIFNFLIRMEEISNFVKMRRKYSKKMFNVKCFWFFNITINILGSLKPMGSISLCLEDQVFFIFKFCLSGCLSVWLFVSNKRQND